MAAIAPTTPTAPLKLPLPTTKPLVNPVPPSSAALSATGTDAAATQQVTQGGTVGPSTSNQWGGFYQPAPGGADSIFNPLTGKSVSGTLQGYTLPGGTQLSGLDLGNGTFLDSYGQVVNSTTGLTSQGAKPYGQAVGMAVPGAGSPYGSSATAGPLSGIIGPSATLAKGATPGTAIVNPDGTTSVMNPGGTFTTTTAPAASAPGVASSTGDVGFGAGAGTTGAPGPTGVAGASAQTGNPTLDALLNGSNSTGAGSVNLSPTTAANSLIGQTISPGALTDPVQQALAAMRTFQAVQAPQEAAAIRQAERAAAATGALKSGMLDTSLGNIASQTNLQNATQAQTLLEKALQQANQNAYANVGIAQQQQGFQQGQLNDAIQQALAELQLGLQGNPAAVDAAMAQLKSLQAAQGNTNLGNLVTSTTAGG